MTVAYLYKWTEISTKKWYIGSRTAKNCHPDDGYICSSKIVKPLIKNNRGNWKREILCIGHPEDMCNLEATYLQSIRAVKDDMSYNLHDKLNFSFVGGKHSDETKDRIRQATLKRVFTDEQKLEISNKIKKCKAEITDETRKKLSISGKKAIKPKHTEEHNRKIGIASASRPMISEKTRNRMRMAQGGENNPMFGKKRTPESIQRGIELRRINKILKGYQNE